MKTAHYVLDAICGFWRGVMKKIKYLSLAIIAGLLIQLAGCGGNGGYTVTNPIGEISLPNMLALNYTNFDGVRFGDYFPVGENEILEFQVSILTEEGSLAIFMTPEGDDEKIVYQVRDLQTSEFSFTLDEPGQYKLWLEGDNHKGGYTISAIWKEKPKK